MTKPVKPEDFEPGTLYCQAGYKSAAGCPHKDANGDCSFCGSGTVESSMARSIREIRDIGEVLQDEGII